MPLISSAPSQTFDPAEVSTICESMTSSDDDGWVYKPRHDPSGKGRSVIDIYDQNNDFVGTL